MRRVIRFSLLLLVCLLTVVAFSKATGNPDSESFFRSLDDDADGDVDADELRKVIREVGGEHFDESHEIEVGVENALRLDNNNDKALLHRELVAQWMTFASLMNPEMVGDWMQHAVGLREEAANCFVQANWTGIDLPRLVSGNPDAALAEINVFLTRTERIKLLGAVKLRMLNVGSVPQTPELRILDSSKTARCGSVLLSWSSPKRAFPEVHKYRLFRRPSSDDDVPEQPWKLVFEGLTTTYSDRTKDSRYLLFDYRIEAWNIIGPSQASEIHDVEPSRRGCESASWFFDFVHMVMDMRMYSVNIIGILTFLYYYLRPASEMPVPHTRRIQPVVGPNGSTLTTNGTGSAPRILWTQSDIADELRAESSSTRLPANSISMNDSIRPALTQRTVGKSTRRPYSTNRCWECNQKVTRATRHQCGVCLRVFCIKHTAIHPHMEARVPGIGTVILSTCGIESKCRCWTCAGVSSMVDESHGNVSTVSQSKNSSSKFWGIVKRDILLRKSVRIWKRKESESQNEDDQE